MSSLVFAFNQLTLSPRRSKSLVTSIVLFTYCDLAHCTVVPHVYFASNQVPLNTAGVMVRSPPQQMKHVADCQCYFTQLIWTHPVDVHRVRVFPCTSGRRYQRS